MNICAVCKRSDFVITVKSCFGQQVCGSCKKNYYKVTEKLVKVLTDYDQNVKCSDRCFIQCDSSNTARLVNNLCISCRFLIAADLFGHKIPEVVMQSLSMSRQSFLYTNMRKFTSTNEIGCVERRKSSEAVRKIELDWTETIEDFQKFKNELTISATRNKHELVLLTGSDDQKISNPFQYDFWRNNISDWSFNLTHILSCIENDEMSKVILKNDDSLVADNTCSKKFLQIYSDSFYFSRSVMEELSEHDKRLSFEYYKRYHFKFYLEVFISLFENTAKIMFIDGNKLNENYLKSDRKQREALEIKRLLSRFGYLTIWFAGMCSLHQNRFNFVPYSRFSASIFDVFTAG